MSERRSAELRHGLGRVVEEEDGEVLCLLFRLLNTNRGSMVSRFLDCGGRLVDAYGSSGSPAGVKGLLYAPLLGLCSRDGGTD